MKSSIVCREPIGDAHLKTARRTGRTRVFCEGTESASGIIRANSYLFEPDINGSLFETATA
eukprot:2288372-Pleurochrysis_carterae.AAC.1